MDLRRPALVLPLLAACSMVSHQIAVTSPLDSEGEIFAELQPLPGDAARLVFEVASAAAVRSDGRAIPLQVAPDGAPDRQHLLVSGRVEPGAYTGLEVAFKRATLRGSDLLVSKEPLRIEAPFAVSQRRASILWLALQPGSTDQKFAFAPSFAVSIPAKAVVALTAYCSDAGAHELTVFDKRARAVTGVLPTGRAPWGLALDPIASRAYVALSDDDQVAIVDIANGAEVSRIRLNAGDSPRELLLTPDRRLLLSANAGSNSVSLIEPGSMIEVGRVQTGDEPTSLLLDRKGTRAYVFNQRSSSISVLDLGSRSVVATVPTENAPLRGQIDRAGTRLYVASTNSAYLTVFSLPDLSVSKRVYVGLGTSALKVDSNTDLLYVANGIDKRLAVFDPFSLLPIDYLEVSGAVSWMAIDDAENALFVLLPESHSVEAIHLTTKKPLGGFSVGAQPRVLALMGERN